jgi:methyltransferase-like protein/SAM-dependent methyltransferase
MSTDKIKEAYQSIPYEGHAFAHTDPNHLAALGALFGLNTAHPSSCRVLEIACAEGRNLFPLAAKYPSSEFVGIDLTDGHIQTALSRTQQLDLKNLSFHCCDYADFSNDSEFDYIIIHGLYSWIPRDDRTSLLRQSRKLLSGSGVIYVSYNTLPGWHLRKIIRDFLLYTTREISSAKEKLQAAREALRLWAKGSENPLTVSQQLIKAMLHSLEHLPDWYIFHELLELHNYPLYFQEFIVEAAEGKLQYVCDSEVSTVSDYDLPEETQAVVRTLASDILSHEQYNDFMRQRMFRRSLLARDDASIDRKDMLSVIVNLEFSSALTQERETEDATVFKSPQGAEFEVPVKTELSAALKALTSSWPGTMSFAALFDAAKKCGEASQGQPSREQLSADLFQCLMRNMLWLHREAVSLPDTLPTSPFAPHVTRQETTWSEHTTSLKHEDVILSKPERHLVQALDGTRTIDELENQFGAEFKKHDMNIRETLENMRLHALIEK